jgi:hypothetical protein
VLDVCYCLSIEIISQKPSGKKFGSSRKASQPSRVWAMGKYHLCRPFDCDFPPGNDRISELGRLNWGGGGVLSWKRISNVTEV